MLPPKPGRRPANPRFSSGPCAKRPGWSLAVLEGALTGRSHRSTAGRERLARAIDLTRSVLQVPASHRIAIVPASDTGAVEMAMWSLLGPRGVDVLAWEAFGKEWITDALELPLADVRTHLAPYGYLPDLAAVDFARDVVFTWNGTAAGVRVPSADWIPADRSGLTICDATSAAFAMPLDWDKLDVVTFSWQKVMGGEAAHGMLILGPRAVSRLESHVPAWPLPKIFRLTRDGRLNESLFSRRNHQHALDAVRRRLPRHAGLGRRPRWSAGAARARRRQCRRLVRLGRADPLDRFPGARPGHPLDHRRLACASSIPRSRRKRRPSRPPTPRRSSRNWKRRAWPTTSAPIAMRRPGCASGCGATVETADIEALTEWLDWAFARCRRPLAQAA